MAEKPLWKRLPVILGILFLVPPAAFAGFALIALSLPLALAWTLYSKLRPSAPSRCPAPLELGPPDPPRG